MVAYGPARSFGRGIQSESKEQLAKNNADLLQEIADMRGSQNLWVERAEQVFALQKERFEQVAEKYTNATHSRFVEEQEQFQRTIENLRKDSAAHSQSQTQNLRKAMEDEMSGYMRQQLALQRQRLAEEDRVQRATIVAEARQ